MKTVIYGIAMTLASALVMFGGFFAIITVCIWAAK